MQERDEEKVPVVGEIHLPAPMRQIVIETDGNRILIAKAEVAGNIEMAAIFRALADQFGYAGKAGE